LWYCRAGCGVHEEKAKPKKEEKPTEKTTEKPKVGILC
jgi:hypothetical protein